MKPSGRMDVYAVMHDFEWVLINLVETSFGCQFHFGCFSLEMSFEEEDVGIQV